MKILVVLSVIIHCGLIYSQSYSEIVFEPGTNIEVQAGADVCANSIIVNGSFTGGGTFCTGPLPVTISEFSASVNKNNVTLIWQTETELNNSGFDIERSSVGSNSGWQKIAFVQGYGTTTEPKNYTFEDKKLQSGSYHYRLKQIDYNGSYEYFDLNSSVIISKPAEFMMGQNYPNPSNPKCKIDYQLPFDARVIIRLYDVLGREVTEIVNSSKTAGFYTAEFDGSNFASGIYFYTITASSAEQKFAKTLKLVISK